MVGGRGTHPVTAVAGGITFRLDDERRRTLASWVSEAAQLSRELAAVGRELLERQIAANPVLLEQWTLPAWSVGTVRQDRLSLYDGLIRAVDERGTVRAEFPAASYHEHVVESSFPWSYMKPVRFSADGAEHVYRVGPLARLNAAERLGTPFADRELEALRAAHGRTVHRTVLQTCARAIEMVYAAERASAIVADPMLTGETRVAVRFRGGRGVGHVEAPRGTLFHDYEIDEQGIVRSANLVVATQQNYDAINRSIEQAAATHVLGRGREAVLNAIEFAIRCYDPCLSCATHALGRMPLEVVVRREGTVVDCFGRGM